jgi:hypothetical protein
MKLEIIFNDSDTLKYKEFIRRQVKGHHDEECEYPGATLEISYHPALGDQVALRVGSAVCDFDSVVVKYFED